MDKSETIKNILTGAAPLISAITESFFKPKIKDLANKLNLKKQNIEHIFTDKFSSYLMASYEKYSITDVTRRGC